MQGWSPCEIESFNLSQAIKKFKPYIRYVNTKTTVLVDSRASVLALQRLERGQMSTSRRLQDLLANVTAENLKVIHISAKMSSPMIEYADFASRNPVHCEKKACSICKESESPDITFFGRTSAEDENPIENMPNITTQMWKSIQSSSSNLRKAAALMESGKSPHRRDRNNDITRYLRQCTLSQDGLVVAKNDDKSQPFLIKKNKIIVKLYQVHSEKN